MYQEVIPLLPQRLAGFRVLTEYIQFLIEHLSNLRRIVELVPSYQFTVNIKSTINGVDTLHNIITRLAVVYPSYLVIHIQDASRNVEP